MPVKAKKLGCCSARSTKLKKANFDKAKKAAEAAIGAKAGAHTHMQVKKAKAKKATAKKAKPCKACK
jgi:hypothetical protein